MSVYGKRYKGRGLYDVLESYIRRGFMAEDETERKRGRDIMWYIWLGENSPLFGKDKMATFERYFLEDEESHKEKKNPYYRMLENEKTVDMILGEFGLGGEESHIINGHVPVKSKNGENPVKCGGKVLVIDGGFSRAYQKETGIAGYTLIFNSHHLALAEHKPFDPERERTPKVYIVEKMQKRITVADTDEGKELAGRIEDLKELLKAYRSGLLKERVR